MDRAGIVVLRDGAANYDASAARKIRESSFQNVTTDVVEVDVDALRASLSQDLRHVFGLVIYDRVKSQIGDEIAALVCTARDTDRAAALDFGNLPHDRAHGPSRRRHDYSVAKSRLAGFEQAEICRHTRHAQHVEESWKRRHARVSLD